jgi:uncharacterized protein (DUF1778 family)
MKILEIPERYYPGIQQLINITEETSKNLIDALKDLPPSANVARLAVAVQSKVDELEIEDVFHILDVITALYILMSDRGDSSPKELSEEIAKAVLESDNFNDINNGESVQHFKERLVEFLEESEVLGITSKASDVMYDHERIFRCSRILTDIRPVFKVNEEDVPAAAGIVHYLKIQYQGLSGEEEFFVGMDEQDIEQLLEQLERALRKAKTLKLILKKADVPFLVLNPGVDAV